MKKLLFLFLVLAITAMAGCSFLFPDKPQGGNDQEPVKVYTVRFVPNGAPLISSVKVNEGEHVPEPEEPVLEGKIFDGWYSDPELTIEWDFEFDVVIEDTKLYAKWLDGHTHSYERVVTAPTCTADGFSTFTCSCGDEYDGERVNALGHEHVLTLVAPTCTEGGYSLLVCERCSHTYKESPTAPKGHIFVVDAAKEPTCTESGLSEGAHCHVCNDVLVPQTVIEPTGHSYTHTVTEPTCTDAGFTTHICSVCEHRYTDSEVDALGHNEITDAAKEPGCTTKGLTEGKHCDVCGTVIVAQEEISANGHTHQSIPAKTPDCTNTGLTAGVKCSVCDEILVSQNEIPALGHKEEIIKGVAPTCSSTGLTEGKKCSVCNEILLEQTELEKLSHTPGPVATCTTPQICTVCNETVVSALGHTPVEGSYCDEAEYCQTCGEVFEGFDHTILPATCTEPEKCKNCPYIGADALGHDHVAVVTEPTCTVIGYTSYICTRCSDNNGNKRDNIVTALGHSYVDVVTAPTCTEGGYTTRTCSRCEQTTVTNRIPSLGHDYKAGDVILPTCTTEGYTVYACSRCDATENRNSVAANGHNYQKKIVAPTCTEEGYTVNTCTRCDDEYNDSFTDPLGHSYTENIVAPTCTEQGYTVNKCTRCDDKYQDNITSALGHEYRSTVVAPNCNREGYTEHVCGRCTDKYRDNYTAKTSHEYNGGAYCVNCNAPNPSAIVITYVLNGAENDPRNLDYFMSGNTPTLYNPLSREGYEFRGWYLDESLTEEVTSLEGITSNVTLYSKWVRVYNGNYDDGIETPEVPF